jgi:hypothetical protein
MAGAQDRVLATEVFGHAVAMIGSVVLDYQPGGCEVKIRSAEEFADIVVQLSLDLWAGKPRLPKQPTPRHRCDAQSANRYELAGPASIDLDRRR